MNKLRELLAKAQAKLIAATKLKTLAGHRWQVNHDLAHEQHKQQKLLERQAAHLHIDQRPELLAAAQRHSHRAYKAHKRAIYWIGKAKEAEAKIGRLGDLVSERQHKLKFLEAKGCHRDGNRIVGGSDYDNLEYAMHYSMEHGSQYYSQTGTLTFTEGLTGPSAGHRHDCSSWDWSMLYAAGIPDPTGADYHDNVFTGNEAEHGEVISERELDTGCDVFFGTAPFHHVEKKTGPISQSSRTIGHGSDPIDYGSVTLLPGPRAFRRYVKK